MPNQYLHHRLLQGVPDNFDSLALVFVGRGHAVEDAEAAEESGAAAGNDSFFDGGASRVQRVGHAVLLLVHLHLTGAADLQNL